ncbi:PTS system, ascorbate-specific IIB component [Bifidobacterium bohemicum]|uniref:PTS system, ascorbate-specific IIB component n=1 Tax=Bifidobacterium bohemicum DSM 22767 TaxID=1437606 RepID=A0A086ZF26_9BIFI|nr:PTS sugar transporter subunit IIB [Bifidobacterium bohemicum]KFI45126.1 PTS system, ascorbate-specific IIB component [Bifidobacterium bohemicum DSM 22767]SCB90882.1 PTS system, ascorbate-specific IIB component [Bifidobacterium bohemicum]
MDILCVCGMGIGTSVILRSNVEQVAADMGLDVNVQTADAGSAMGTANMCDLVLTSAELAGQLSGTSTPVEVVSNFMDKDEIRSVLEKYAA